MRWLLISLLLPLLGGCITIHSGDERQPEEVPRELRDYYDYPRLNPKTEYGSMYIPFNLPQDEMFNQPYIQHSFLYNTIRMDYRVPHLKHPNEDSKRPAIIISPIMGGNEVVDIFAKYFANQGYVTLLVHRRRPMYKELDYSLDNVETHLRAAVIRLRQATDWLEKRPDVDPDRIGTFGISYGSIMHCNFIAIDKRPKFHVLALSGAPIGHILADSQDKGIKSLVDLLAYENTREQMGMILQVHVKTDPQYLARYIDPQDVVMYVAQFDRVVHTKHGMNLWEKIGKPELRKTPFGHYSTILMLPIIQRQTLSDFKERL
jgi:hypothetical protein